MVPGRGSVVQIHSPPTKWKFQLASARTVPVKLSRCACGRSPLRSGEYANHTAGGVASPAGRSSRTYAHNRSVFVFPLPAQHRCRPRAACSRSSRTAALLPRPQTAVGSERRDSGRVVGYHTLPWIGPIRGWRGWRGISGRDLDDARFVTLLKKDSKTTAAACMAGQRFAVRRVR
jgi:hypothetical protein